MCCIKPDVSTPCDSVKGHYKSMVGDITTQGTKLHQHLTPTSAQIWDY